MKPQYKDHLTEWRPDYPPVWNDIYFDIEGNFDSFDRLEPSKSLPDLRSFNMHAFTTSVKAIIKAMKP